MEAKGDGFVDVRFEGDFGGKKGLGTLSFLLLILGENSFIFGEVSLEMLEKLFFWSLGDILGGISIGELSLGGLGDISLMDSVDISFVGLGDTSLRGSDEISVMSLGDISLKGNEEISDRSLGGLCFC